MKSAKSNNSTSTPTKPKLSFIILMNIFSLLYFLVNVHCVNENENKQYSILCLDNKCTEKIAHGSVNELIVPQNPDYLNANLNDSFDVLGFNKDVYLVRKEQHEGLISRKSVKILKNLHTPTIQVVLSLRDRRVSVFAQKVNIEPQKGNQTIQNQASNTISHEKHDEKKNSSAQDSIAPIRNDISKPLEHNTNHRQVINESKQIKNPSTPSPSFRLDTQVDQQSEENLARIVNEGSTIAKSVDHQKETKTVIDSNEKIKEHSLHIIEDDLNDEKIDEKIDGQIDEKIDEKIDGQIDGQIDEKIDGESNKEQNLHNIDTSDNDLEDEEEIDEKIDDLAIKLNEHSTSDQPSIKILSDSNNHYVKMNSIESSTTDTPFDQAESSYFCSLPASDQNEMTFYLNILRYVLGKMFVDRLPESLVTFLKIKLLVSVHLIVFVLLIGIIWLLSYFVTFVYMSIDNKTKLKNQLCELQAQLSALKSEQQLKRNSTLQAGSKAQNQKLNELEEKLNDLVEEKASYEMQLKESKKEILMLNEKKQEMEDLIEIQRNDVAKIFSIWNKTKANSKQRLQKLEENLNELNNTFVELKQEKQVQADRIKEQNEKIAILNELLEESKSRIETQNNQDNSITTSEHIHVQTLPMDTDELVQLELANKTLQEERDELKSNVDLCKSTIVKLEQDLIEFEKFKAQLILEKEESERLNMFSKKYMKEMEDELQTTREQIEKLYLKSEKQSSEQWQENQSLNNDLNLIRCENEQLRKQIAKLIQDDKNKGIPAPPEMPQELLNYLRFATSPTRSIQHPQSPSNHSQISDYQQPSLHNYSANNHSYVNHHHSSTVISPTHSISNLSIHSNQRIQPSIASVANDSFCSTNGPMYSSHNSTQLFSPPPTLNNDISRSSMNNSDYRNSSFRPH